MSDAPDLSDIELVDATRTGDRSAFAELWRRHARAGLTVARSHTDLDADDLVSEAYAKIYQAIANGNGPTSGFRAYLFTTIRSVAASWGRRSRETPIDDADTLEDPAFSEEAGLEALDRSLTANAFRTLPTRWQEVLWYSEVERMKPAEIGPLLGMSANAVAALAYRAREGLRQAWIQAHLASVPEGSDCRWTTERLGAYARHGLGKRETARLEAHLVDCARCTIVAAEAKDVGSRIALVLLPLAAGVGGATAYTAWVQSGANAVSYALGSSGAVMPAAATGGTGLTLVGAGSGAGAGTGAGSATAGSAGAGASGAGASGAGAASGSAGAGGAGASGAGGSGGGIGVVGVTSFAIGGVLVAAAVAAAAVFGPSLFPSAPTPTSAAVAEPASPSAPAPSDAADPPAGAPTTPAPAPTSPTPGTTDPAPVDAPVAPVMTSPGAPSTQPGAPAAPTVPTTPTDPSTPTTPTAPRPQPPVLAGGFPADGTATNALALDASGTAVPGAAIAATASPVTGSGLAASAASAASLASAASAVSLGSATAGEDGLWGLGLDLAALGDGTWSVSFAQTTADGTSDPVARTLVIDRTALPPEIASVDTGSGTSAGYGAPIVSGSAEPGATVDVSDGGLLLETVVAGADGSWTTGELVHASAAFALTARQTDALGNVSDPSAATTGSVLAPSVTASTLLLTLTVTAYGRPDTDLRLYVDGEATGQTLRTAVDGTAGALYVWAGSLGAHRIGVGYDIDGRRGILVDAPVTLLGTP